MKTPPSDPEFAKFTEAMREIMKVSKVELQRRDAEWRAFRQERLAAQRLVAKTVVCKENSRRSILQVAVKRGKELFGMNFSMIDPRSKACPFRIETKRDISVFLSHANPDVAWEPKA